MLAFNFVSHHWEGSIYFMTPLTLLFLASVSLFIYMLVKREYESKWLEVFKHLGLLTFAFGMVGTLTGFLQMFDALESMKEALPLSVISGGVKVALLNVAYGAAYFCLIQTGYLILKIVRQRTTT